MIEGKQSPNYQTRSDELSLWEQSAADDNPSPGLFVDYYRTLVRHKTLIVLAAVACACVALLSQLTTQPTYRTRTSLNIQSVNSDFLNLHSVNPTSSTPSDTLVQTQVKLLQSDALIDRVTTHLRNQPHPGFILRNDLLSQLQRFIHLGGMTQIPYEDMLTETAKSLKIKPMGITQLIEITCDSVDATFAANFCNALTREFREIDLESRGDEAKRTSDWLVRQAGDIRQKAEESEKRLVAATKGDGLILSEQGNSVGEDGLRSMQSELVRARGARMEIEAKLATRQAANQTAAVEESPAYAADKVRLSELQTQLAALVPPLTESNPRVIHLRAQIHQVEENLSKEKLASERKLQDEYDAAKQREALLVNAYSTQESHVSSTLQRSSEVSLLRKEVESEQQFYQTLLQRAKEAGFASAMPASTIRVVDAAKVPQMPALPRRIPTILSGLFIGGFIGLLLAFYRERSTALLRAPGDSERLLRTDELGVIPSPQPIRRLISARNLQLTTGIPRKTLTSGASHAALETARWNDNFSLVAEAYRNTTISILNSNHKRTATSYAISSPSAGEGKTTVTCNIGVALSKARLRVVLIDGDLRKPSLHQVFSVSNKIGLRQILSGQRIPLTDFCHATDFENLSVISAGSGEDTTVELLHSKELGKLIAQLALQFDVILVDTPPMLHMADARIIAKEVERTILVFRAGVTTQKDALSARTMLSRDEIKVVGTILNDFNPRTTGDYGYYASYAAYRKGSEEHAAVRS
ncbi:MAG: polysaccharide biosynthesis tyrosine autokinase [Edaphobacter sp.]|uniref:GumC family protein n=1 Tax=Edaphobacter sp. TaxID=1934404 RepID=UPI0023A5162A|nr:polysaccharide biosynthesis tyrosine autokinase [Edaphobacter sp.]MDE1175569.1 polysaccharide biosynthesis tyrosine autokinase [Edaphobacter sp.]